MASKGSINPSRPFHSSICLVWVQSRSALYTRLGRLVLREVCRYLHSSPALLMLFSKSHFRVFRFHDESWSRRLALSQEIQYEEGAQATPLSEDHMLICGGRSNYSNPLRCAYKISVDGEVTVLPEMTCGRSMFGLIAYNGCPYAFGDSEDKKSSERLPLRSQHWEALPPMNCERSFFTPAEFHAQIYLCSGRTMEVFDPAACTFTLLPLELEGSSWTFLLAKGDELCIVNSDWTGVARLEGNSLKLVKGRKRWCHWPLSECTPVVYGNCLYFTGNSKCFKSYILR